MYRDLTRGSISRSLVLFALPMMADNMLHRRNRHMDGNTHRLASDGHGGFNYNVQKQAFTKAINAGKL